MPTTTSLHQGPSSHRTAFEFPFGTTAYSDLDGLLRAGQAFSQIRGGDFTNHSTLTAEALAFLGLADAAHQVVEADDGWYVNEPGLVVNAVPTGQRVTERTVLSAAGDASRLGDLNEFFTNQALAEDPRRLISNYVPLVATDVSADLFHGVIQVAHAMRDWPLATHLSAGKNWGEG